ncbi:MAG: hypothetical protein HY720_32080 [Planctomycetes bacterium]|nr:hypothetical protein [Planctomycetota bacterium]
MAAEDTGSRETPEGAQYNQVVFAGLLAVGLIIMQDFFLLDEPDPAAWVSVASFAVAIPLLATMAIANRSLENLPEGAVPWYMTAIAVLGVLGAYVGTIAAFWHVRWWAGALFGTSSLVGLAASGMLWVRTWSGDPAGRPVDPDDVGTPN